MNFFGVLGQLGRMLPGYVDGRRQAIQDNWQDMQNYNNVLHGQMQNALDIGTFEPQMSNVWNNADLNQLATLQGAGNFLSWLKTYPAQFQNALPLYMQGINNQSQLAQMMMQLLGQQLQPQQQAQQQPTQQTTTNPQEQFNKMVQP